MDKCEHKGKKNERRGFHECNHKDKIPGLRLCVKVETCPKNKTYGDGCERKVYFGELGMCKVNVKKLCKKEYCPKEK